MFENSLKIYNRIKDNIRSVFRGNEFNIDLILFGYLTNGHILLQDFPGTGKTTLAKALAMSVRSDFKRIQFTPDLLPTDITGVNIFNSAERKFQLQKGPVFTNILLADEINRTTSRTQSALLEAMEEKQVTIDGDIYTLDDDFFVIATLNPAELQGTYPLPESQIDRFAMRFSLGYVSKDEEKSILEIVNPSKPLEFLKPCVTKEEIDKVRIDTVSVRIDEDIKDYIVEIVRRTREYKGVLIGASPRASIAIMKLSKIMALSEGSDYVIPEYIEKLAPSVLNHRIILDQFVEDTSLKQENIIDNILKETPVPR
ncbi:MAG: MoxR family ATPase [Candidatus Delongbacteria bacterium]